jgi:UPF0716 family protein affecting phage T7 exclusion
MNTYEWLLWVFASIGFCVTLVAVVIYTFVIGVLILDKIKLKIYKLKHTRKYKSRRGDLSAKRKALGNRHLW